MRSQMTTLRESLIALHTLVAFYASVPLQMPTQIRLQLKHFTANVTPMNSTFFVNFLMPRQVQTFAELFIADFTFEGFLAGMYSRMAHQFGIFEKLFLAKVALEGGLHVVLARMKLEVTIDFESFCAEHTFVPFQKGRMTAKVVNHGVPLRETLTAGSAFVYAVTEAWRRVGEDRHFVLR